MKTLVLKDLLANTSSSNEGLVLYNYLKESLKENDIVLLKVDSDLTMSSSFLNASIGLFLDNYGIDVFKKSIKFKGSKTQFSRLADYIEKYKSLYLV